MKRTGFLLVIAFLAIGAVSAQNWRNQWGASQSVTVEGTLRLQNGQIAVSTGNAIYYVPVLNQYIGFIDGLKEGASISVSGYVSGNILQPSQVTINGKSYVFQSPRYSNNSDYVNYGSCCYGWGTGNRGRRW